MLLYYFIFGILFVDIILPILEGAAGCLCTRMEQYKVKCATTIAKMNEEIEKYQEMPINEQPIGFQIPSETEYIEEEQDE